MGEQRMSLSVAPAPYEAMTGFDRSIDFDPRLRELIKLRASQINGCAYCIDMHWKDARVGGESEERLYALDAWREYPIYDEREQAALDLCEAITLVADSHVPDEVWDRAATAFPEPELAQLVYAIAAINTWNRLAISTRSRPGLYKARPHTA